MDPTREARRSRPRGASWDPDQYRRFGDHRLRPALELLHRVQRAAASLVYDLGCGTGTVTWIIAERFSTARVIGLDSSPKMLAKASAQPSRIEWGRADIADWEPGQAPELIYSKTALHWLRHHPTLFPRLLGYLAPRGCLAVQMPLSHSQPSHALMCETLANGGAGGSPLGDEALAAAAAREWVLDGRCVPRTAGAAGGDARHLGDRVPPPARRRRCRPRMGQGDGAPATDLRRHGR